MKIRSILFLLLLAIPVFAVSQKKGYIGYRHKGVVYGKTLPNGVKDLGGGLLSDENLGITRYTKSGNDMLWLERILSRDKNGVPMWQVKDVLTFDKLRKNQELLFSYSSTCTQNGRENLDLVILAELAADKKSYKVLKAWNAEIRSEKFRKISTDGIRCDIGVN